MEIIKSTTYWYRIYIIPGTYDIYIKRHNFVSFMLLALEYVDPKIKLYIKKTLTAILATYDRYFSRAIDRYKYIAMDSVRALANRSTRHPPP